MQFNSIEFLFYFLPVFLVIYRLFPQSSHHLPLIVGSLFFYALSSGGSYWWVALLCLLTFFTWLAGLSLGGKAKKGFLLGIYLVLMGGLLTFFKLWNGGRYLPAGMSFYLFQMAAYLIDVYRRRLRPTADLMSYATQITMFPKLLSGPLMEPKLLNRQDRYCITGGGRIHEGLQELILGLALKVILANRIGGLWSQAGVLGYDSVSTPFAWLALAAYAMQLYFDFYGYSLMAMGLGKMLGYELPRNFDDPYASKTVSEFYRRWHITLGAWFREYLYIPLGGSRCGMGRTILNLAVVWLFTGLWHGVGGNYLLWAGFLFLLIVNERLWLGKLMNKSRVLCHIYVPVVILLSWVPFAIGDWDQMVAFLGRLLGLSGQTAFAQDYITWGISYGWLLLGGLILATPLPRKLWERIKRSTIADLLLLALFWLVVYFISTAAQDPFLYFQY